MAKTFGSNKAGHRPSDASATQDNPLWVSSWKKGNPQIHRGSVTTSHRESATATDRSRIAMLLAGNPADDETAQYNGVPTRLTAFSRRASTSDVLQRESYVMATLRQCAREAAQQTQSIMDIATRQRRFRRPTPWAQTIGRLCGLVLLWKAANSTDI